MKTVSGPLSRDPGISTWAAQWIEDEDGEELIVFKTEPETIEQYESPPEEVLTHRGQAVVAARLLACGLLAAGFGWRPAFLIGVGLGVAALALEVTGTTSKLPPAEA